MRHFGIKQLHEIEENESINFSALITVLSVSQLDRQEEEEDMSIKLAILLAPTCLSSMHSQNMVHVILVAHTFQG